MCGETGLPIFHVFSITKEISFPVHRNDISALAPTFFADNQILNSISLNSVHDASWWITSCLPECRKSCCLLWYIN